MFSGIGIWEILVILFITLLVVGPEKIPDVARAVGKGLREAKRATNYFRDVFTFEEEPDYVQRQQQALRTSTSAACRSAVAAGPVDQPMDDWEREQAEATPGKSKTSSVPLAPRCYRFTSIRFAVDTRAESIDGRRPQFESSPALVDLSARRVRSWS